MSSFGKLAMDRIDELRGAGKRNVLSLERVAEESGLTKRTLEKWKSGNIQTPSKDNVVAVLIALGVDEELARQEVSGLKRTAARQSENHTHASVKGDPKQPLALTPAPEEYSQRYGLFITTIVASSISDLAEKTESYAGRYWTTIDCDRRDTESIVCEISDFVANILAKHGNTNIEGYFSKSSVVRSAQRSLEVFHSYGNATDMLRFEPEPKDSSSDFPFSIERVLASGLQIEDIATPGTKLLNYLVKSTATIELKNFEDVTLVLTGLPRFPHRLLECVGEILRDFPVKNSLRFIVNVPELDEFKSGENLNNLTTRMPHALLLPLVYGISIAEGMATPRTWKTKKLKLDVVLKYFSNDIANELIGSTENIEDTRASTDPDLQEAQKLLGNFFVKEDTQALDQCIVRFARANWDVVSEIIAALLAAANLKLKGNVEFVRRAREATRIIYHVRLGKMNDRGVQLVYERVLGSSIERGEFELRVEAAYQLAYSAFLAEDLKKAYDLIEFSGIRERPTVAAVSFFGAVAHQIGETDEAVLLFEEALSIQNDYEYAHFYLGVLKDDADLDDEAVDHYVSALLLRPDFYEASLNLTNSLLKIGRFVDAARVSSYMVFHHKSVAAELISNLAVALAEAGYSSAALAMLKETYASSPAAIIAYNIAMIYYLRRQDAQCHSWIDVVARGSSEIDYVMQPAKTLRKALKQRPINQFRDEAGVPPAVDQGMGADIALIFATQEFDPEHPSSPIVKQVQKALRKASRPPVEYMPRGKKRQLENEASKARSLEERERRKEIARAIRMAEHSKSNKGKGRTRRRKPTQIVSPAGSSPKFLRAPSYSGG